MAVNTIRFSGLASGLDTESIVKSMVAPYKLKVDSKKQDQMLMELRKDAWKEMNAKLFTFYDKQVNKMRLESTFNKSKVSSSNDSLVQLDPNATLPAGTHDLTVSQLATGTRVQTEQIKTTAGGGVTGATTLAELGIPDNSTIQITNNGKTVPITLKSGDTIESLGIQLKTAAPDYSVSFDNGMDAFFISSKNTGSDQTIKITGDTAVLKSLGIKDGGSGESLVTQGQNAIVEYNKVPAEFQSNSISINGLSMTLKSQGSTTLVSSKDTEATFNSIKEFVGEYNKLIDEMTTKVKAPSARDYKPLTDEQKKDMSDSDIEAWDKKIKDSIFRNDDAMKQVTSTMRQVMGSVVKDAGADTGLTLASIGITTGNWKDYGKLTIDETKLKQALADNPEDVTKLFSANGDPEALYKVDNPAGDWKTASVEEKAKYQDQIGIADRLYNSLTDMTMSNEIRSKYSFYNDKALNKEIVRTIGDHSTLVERMDRMEKMYYKQFTAMEKMMQNLNSQSSWVTQQLGGM